MALFHTMLFFQHHTLVFQVISLFKIVCLIFLRYPIIIAVLYVYITT